MVQADIEQFRRDLKNDGVRVAGINNRRYLGNKHSLTQFIRETIHRECDDVRHLVDIFAGTGSVAHAFRDIQVTTNDLLFSNYVSHIAWFFDGDYRPGLIVESIRLFNDVESSENNYVRENFADTYFSADVCSAIGEIREAIHQVWVDKLVTKREAAILLTSLIYGMDRIANTVGHYDAYRRNVELSRELVLPVLIPDIQLDHRNKIFNQDANALVSSLACDVLYLDPPYNSRQYSDAYHLLENIARWQKPEVFGVARKMDRTSIKSDYNTRSAPEALRDLVNKANARYIVLSYNNMADKGNGRSNAKISDSEILAILATKGKVSVFETAYKSFSTGKSQLTGNTERLFVCKVAAQTDSQKSIVKSPINYIGGKGKLMPQLQPLLPPVREFVDVFAGGCTVGANVQAKKVFFNDVNEPLVDLMKYLTSTPPAEVEHDVDQVVAEFGLTDSFHNSYEYYGVHSSNGLASLNKEPYVRLRSAYNNEVDLTRRALYLYVLVIFGFNNQLRFNSKGDFNLPVGKRDFNSKMRRKLSLFYERLASVEHEFLAKDFTKLDISRYDLDALFYCDPPYLITQATYNERGAWNEQRESELLHFLDKVHDSGRRFALSNVLESKGAVNVVLAQWMREREYSLHHLNYGYSNSNYQRKNKDSPTLEVLVTNY